MKKITRLSSISDSLQKYYFIFNYTNFGEKKCKNNLFMLFLQFQFLNSPFNHLFQLVGRDTKRFLNVF